MKLIADLLEVAKAALPLIDDAERDARGRADTYDPSSELYRKWSAVAGSFLMQADFARATIAQAEATSESSRASRQSGGFVGLGSIRGGDFVRELRHVGGQLARLLDVEHDADSLVTPGLLKRNAPTVVGEKFNAVPGGNAEIAGDVVGGDHEITLTLSIRDGKVKTTALSEDGKTLWFSILPGDAQGETQEAIR